MASHTRRMARSPPIDLDSIRARAPYREQSFPCHGRSIQHLARSPWITVGLGVRDSVLGKARSSRRYRPAPVMSRLRAVRAGEGTGSPRRRAVGDSSSMRRFEWHRCRLKDINAHHWAWVRPILRLRHVHCPGAATRRPCPRTLRPAAAGFRPDSTALGPQVVAGSIQCESVRVRGPPCGRAGPLPVQSGLET